MKIVLIAGTIFPQQSPRAFRATELAVGLAKQGHEVTIYAILGDYDYRNFEKEHQLTVRDLGKSYWGNINSDGNYLSRNFFTRGSKKLLNNIIDYPRAEFFFKTLRALKKETKFDYLITIAHPYGIHWGAAFFKKYISNELFSFWVSDCGDPLMGVTNHHRWKLFLKPIEQFWGAQTDKIAIPIESAREAYDKTYRDKIEVIPQGIDFNKVKLSTYKRHEVPTFLYAGTVYPVLRDPSQFLNYLIASGVDFKLYVFTLDKGFFAPYEKQLKGKLVLQPYIDRLELISLMSTMDFLINFTNLSTTQQPSKLIDYGLAQRPILNISSAFIHEEQLAFERFIKGNYSNQTKMENIEQYNSSTVCEQFISLYKRKMKS